jgi:hypothetical protein
MEIDLEGEISAMTHLAYEQRSSEHFPNPAALI